MAIIIGKDRKLKRVELDDVRNGVKEKRMANDRRRDEQKSLAEAEEAAREDAKASKAMARAMEAPRRGRKPKVKEESVDAGSEPEE